MMTKEGSTNLLNFMTFGAGVLALGCGHLSHIVKMHYVLKNLLLYSGAQIKQTKYLVRITKEGSTKIVNFMTPGTGVLVLGSGHISHIVKLIIPLKIFFIDQTNEVCTNDDQIRVYQKCKYHDPGTGALMLWCGHISHYSENTFFFNSSAAFLYHR